MAMIDINEMLIAFVSTQTDRSLRRIAAEMKLTTKELKEKVDSRVLDPNELLDFVRCSRSMELLDGVLDRLRPPPSAGKLRQDDRRSFHNDETAGSPSGSRDMKRLLN